MFPDGGEGATTNLTDHHILKRSVFGRNNRTATLCEACHQKIEKIIGYFESKILQKYEGMYFRVYELFLRNNIDFNANINYWLEIKEVNGKIIYNIKKSEK